MMQFGGYRPRCLADIVACHARYYAEHWGFGLAFEAKVAHELGAFAAGMVAGQDLLLVADDDGRFAGSVVIDASGGGARGAHLRWFIVAVPGRGLGRQLIRKALSFCDERRHPSVWLTTFAGLGAARRLYEEHGFRLIEEKAEDQWQGGVREQFVRAPAQGSVSMRAPSGSGDAKSDFPYWLVAAALVAVAAALAIARSDLYAQVFATVIAGIGITLFVTVVAFALASALGLGIALMQLSGSATARQVARFYVEIIRGVRSSCCCSGSPLPAYLPLSPG